MKKHLFLSCLLAAASVASQAQTTYSTEKDGKTYGIPVGATISIDSQRGFLFSYEGKEYEFPLSTVVTFSDAPAKYPLAIKNSRWWQGFSSLQSGSNGILSGLQGEDDVSFYWRGDSIQYSDYGVYGTVIDTIRNIRITDTSRPPYFGDVIDMVFVRQTKSHGANTYSVPSQTFLPSADTTSIGKYAVLTLSYALDEEGKRLDNAVGVSYWKCNAGREQLIGVSGKSYTGGCHAQFFDDYETARDVAPNLDNWAWELDAPTWYYLSAGSKVNQRIPYSDAELRKYRIGNLEWYTSKKPTQENLDSAFAWRFDTPDSTSAIVYYYYTPSDSTATIKFPMLKSGSGADDASQYSTNENCTWMGSTCLYLVPWNGYAFTKYRKFDGYIHVRMVDGAEYRQHLTVYDKKGHIRADGVWEKTKEATIPLLAECEDNGEFHYSHLKYMIRPYANSGKYGSNVKTFKEANEFELSLTGPNVQIVPKVDLYVPYSFAPIVPAEKMHYCNYSFKPADNPYLSHELLSKGVHLSISDDLIYYKGYDNGWNYWMFTDKDGHIIAYTSSVIGSISAIEWME